MKSFKNKHSETTISLQEMHPKETIKDVHDNLVLRIPILAQFTLQKTGTNLASSRGGLTREMGAHPCMGCCVNLRTKVWRTAFAGLEKCW